MVFTAQMAPWEALLIPMYVIARDAGLLDRLVTLSLIYFMITLPFTVVTLRSFLAGIPVELEEAAQVDGCTRATAFRRVTLPLLAPGLLATSLFGFITAWNEFAFANMLIIKDQDDRPRPCGSRPSPTSSAPTGAPPWPPPRSSPCPSSSSSWSCRAGSPPE